MVRNRECKMVFLATALTLGVGALAACVIPWFYCKPPDADDENHEKTEIHDGTDPGSHFQTAVDENLNPAANIRINGISYVRVVVPTNSSSNQSTIPTSTMLDSATLNAMSQEVPAHGELRHPVHAHNVNVGFQSSGNFDPMTSGLMNSEMRKKISRKAEMAMEFNNNSKVITFDSGVSKSKALEPAEPYFGNSRVSHRGFINSDIAEVRVLIKNEGNTSVRLPSSKSLSPTDESKSGQTIRPPSASSEFFNTDSIRPYDSVTKSKEIPSSFTDSTGPQSSALTSSTGTEERSSMTLTTSEPSNPTDESSTETTNRTTTSQESENFSSGPTKVQTIAIVESSQMPNILETIQEVSTSPAASPSPERRQQLHNPSSGFNKTPNPWVGNEESITSTSTRAFNRMHFCSNQSNENPLNPDTPDSTQSASKRQDAGIGKAFRGSRYIAALSNQLKKIWQGIKPDITPRNGKGKYAQQMESMKSLSAGKKCPDGHSTLISEDQRLIDTIRTRRSPKVLHTCLLKTFEDPGIPIKYNSNCVSKFGIEQDEEPLDLSIRSSSECGTNETADMPTGRRRLNRSADSCKENFCEVAEYLNVKKGPKSSEAVISHSDSLIFSNDITKMCLKDENHNVRSDLSQAENVRIGENATNIGDLHEQKLDKSCLPKSNRFPRSIKKILHIGKKNRNKRHKLSSPLQQEQVSNSASAKCLVHPASTSSQLKSELNVTVIRTPDSCTDMSSYFELGVGKSGDDKYPDEPCTEL